MLKNKEVSCRMVFPLVSEAKNQNLDMSLLFKDTGLDFQYISNPQNRFSWTQFGILMNNLTDRLGYTKDDLVIMGEQLKDSPLYKSVLFVFRLLFTLPEFFEWFHRSTNESPATQSISCITFEISSDVNNNYRLKFKLDEGYKPIWQFYYTSMGVIRILPTIYGLPPIEVTIYEQDDGCVYHFYCPEAGGLLSGLRKLLTFPTTARKAAKTVVKAHKELYEINLQLQRENEQLIKTQKELEIAKLKAEEASKAKSQFIANISHELRTPLNGIIGSVSLMLEEEKAPEKLGSLKVMSDSSESLLSLVNEILTFSKLDSADTTLNLSAFSIHSLHMEISSVFKPAADKKSLTFHSLNQTSPDEYYLGDMVKIRQIINSLLSNAIKFCDQGEVTFKTAWNPEAQQMTIDVSDTGPGIAKDKQDIIFAEFVQLDNSLSRRHEGTGLGLAIVQKLVNKMNGHIQVTSAENEGATFTVTIPAAKTDAPQLAPPDTGTSDSLHSLNILLAEDTPTNQMVVSKLITKSGHKVTIAENGLQCIEKLANQNFDLILMDVMMPEMDGIEATRKIRETYSKEALPILALSANTDIHNIDECMAVGMNEYLHKPIRMQELKSVLGRYSPNLATSESESL